ncbi:sugar transferase, PEP-CTERM system associated/exopolysaccharide biosynthesis polyprenyl glycosylphosphotransferase [Pseudoxanthomonas sp. GM95]|uniref:TIGR03013 family XrtA/PEP-CTERM system glycosyltransferase n=1 Tax=Pseudoxanthomonas sp. GM95 TaxID=1881043 RepID=UPI0008CA6306|nr:TIGR03013 family XrtA/PEP-CTERM system glycosyltransferase [Pseudoxanthomonas sp. GM95]SEL09001.1 sugar transferase, PEP-CTERM system associated/exopolysaccharide biosynthesis polyprenyl glycosylphosphotransferase [Pseudoxanthomonas sp. GM95]
MQRFVYGQAVRWLLLLGAIELLLLAASMYTATNLRFRTQEEYDYSVRYLPAQALLFSFMIILGLGALGQYQTYMRAGWFGLLARQAIGFSLGGLGLVVAYYIIPQAYVGRGVLGLALVIGFISVTAFRAVFLRLVELESFKRRILVLGAGERASHIHKRLRRRSDRRGFCVLGFVPCPGEQVAVPAGLLVRPGQPLGQWAALRGVDEIVVGVEDRRGSVVMEDLLECWQSGIVITDLTTFFEREAGRVQLSLTHPSWLVYSGGFNGTPLRLFTKRAFDLIASLTVLMLTWPLMILVVLAIRIESGAGQPILYRQERVGMHGRTFWLVKFRSMRTDAELDGVARWARNGDDRVTRVGRFTRKVRLDELPQLWNVLKGEMSFIGPRPERPQFVADLGKNISYYNLRHCLKPGLAGWAQLRYPYGASEDDAAEKLKYDLYYVKNHNLLFDLLIMIQTVEVVLFGTGAR